MIIIRLVISLCLLLFNISFFIKVIGQLKEEGFIIALLIEVILILILIIFGIVTYQFLSNRPLFKHIFNTPEKQKGSINNLPQVYLKTMVFKPIQKLAEASEEIDYKNLITLAQNKYALSIGLFKYTVGALIILGLLGTFLGLMESIIPISEALGKNSTEAQEEIRKSLSGIGTAFNTSILGITASLVVGFLNSWFLNLLETKFIQLEHYVQTNYIPLLHEEYSSPSKNISNKLERLGKDLNTLFTKKVDQLVESVEKNTVQTKNELVKIQDNFLTSLRESNESFEQKLNDNHENYIDQLTAQHKIYIIQLGAQLKSLEAKFVASMNYFFGELEKRNLNTIELLEGKATTIYALIQASSKKHLKQIEENLANILVVLDEHSKLVFKQFEEETKKYLEQQIATFNTLSAGIGSQLNEGLLEYLDAQRSLITAHQNNLNQLTEKSNDILTAHQNNLGQFTEQSNDILIVQSQENQKMQNSLNEIKKFYQNQMIDLQKLVNDHLNSFKDKLEQATASYASFSNEVKTISAELGKIKEQNQMLHQEKEELYKAQLDLNHKAVEKAKALISSIKQEQEIWYTAIETKQNNINNTVGNNAQLMKNMQGEIKDLINSFIQNLGDFKRQLGDQK